MSSIHPKEEKNSTEQMIKPSHMRYLYALIRKLENETIIESLH
jgi:hypothetical protein